MPLHLKQIDVPPLAGKFPARSGLVYLVTVKSAEVFGVIFLQWDRFQTFFTAQEARLAASPLNTSGYLRLSYFDSFMGGHVLTRFASEDGVGHEGSDWGQGAIF